MSSKILKSLSAKLNLKADNDKNIDSELDLRSKQILDEHLEKIAAAHSSVHGDHHGSVPDLQLR